MIMINGNWEQVKDLSDVLRIVSENIGSEFAHKIEEICDDYKYKTEELEIDNSELSSELRLKEDCLKGLNRRLDILEDYIEENKDGTDYMRGMEKAFEIIER